jgi:hypothetical protein
MRVLLPSIHANLVGTAFLMHKHAVFLPAFAFVEILAKFWHGITVDNNILFMQINSVFLG